MRAQTITSIQHARIARFAVAVVALVVALGGLSASARAEPAGNTVTEWNAIAASATSRPRASRHTSHRSAWRWCRAPSTTRSTRSTAATGPIWPRPRPIRRTRSAAAAATAAYRRARRAVPGATSRRCSRSTTHRWRRCPTGRAKTGGIAVGEAAAATMLAARANDGRGGPFTVVGAPTPATGGRRRPTSEARPRPVGRQRAPVPRPERRDAAHRGPERAHERRLRGGLQRGQGARLAHEHEAHGRPDGRRDLLAGQRPRDLEPRLPRARGERGARHRRQRPHVRDDEPGRGRRRRSAAGTTSTTGTSGGRSRRSARPRSDGNPATEADPAWLPLFDPTVPVSGPPLVTPGFPDHPSGHTCISGATVHTLKAFFGTDKVAVHGAEQQVLARALPAPELRPLLRGAQGDHRRPRLERHPLPHRRRAGRGARQEGRPPAGKALLPAGQLTLK